jgi:predicted phage terminase large subunit-like protein
MNTFSNEDIELEIKRLQQQIDHLQNFSEDDMQSLTALEEQEYIQAYESSFGFLAHSWNVFNRESFVTAKPLQAIGEHLDACLRGEIKRLVINIYPRAAKSALVNKAFHPYCWIKRPDLRFANISYVDSLAIEGSIHSKQIINSEWYKRGLNGVWRDLNVENNLGDLSWTLSKENRNVQEDYYNTLHGRRFSTSIGGTFTGKGADFIIIDDPVDPKRAKSKSENEKTNKWFGDTAYSRLDNKSNGVIILIQQRLSQFDQTAMVLAEGGWEHLWLPMEWEGEHQRYFTSIGWTDWRNTPGESADPIRFPFEVIEEEKKRVEVWQSQYQQNPVPEGGTRFKVSWLNTYHALPMQLDAAVMAFDLNTKKGAKNDNTALVVMGRKNSSLFILDLVYGNMDFPEQIQAIKNLCDKWYFVHVKLIEDASNGSGIWSMLHREIPGLRTVQPITGLDKETRITTTLLPKFVGGAIYAPDAAIHPWRKYIEDEMRLFPHGKDDLLDALTYSVAYLESHNTTINMPDKIITESEGYVTRSSIRDILSGNDYDMPIQRSNSSIRDLFK